MKQIILYIKTHNKTGLKYFGKTVRDPFKYKGSGKRWLYHLSKHGNDVTTTIHGCYTSLLEAKSAALEFSEKYDIANSTEWANLISENLEGAQLFGPKNGMFGKSMSDEHKQKIKETYKITGHGKGSSNSNYGKMWINNGVISKTQLKSEEIPPGWVKGRLPVKGSFLPGKLNPRFNPNKK